MNETYNIKEPDIKREDILLLEDSAFIDKNICIVTGSGIGRAVAIAASVNGLFTIGVDYNEKVVEKTVEIATNLGGKMDFAIGKDQFMLKTGDSLFFDSKHLHKMNVVGK